MKVKEKDKINIMLVVRHPVGGIRTFLRYVYSRFDAEKFNFIIILPETSELSATFDNLKKLDPEYVILSEKSGYSEYISSILKVIKKNNIDIIHSHGFSSGIFAAVPAKLFGIPHLLTSHDVFRKDQFYGLKGFITKQVLRTAFLMIDKVHSVSDDAQENLFSFYPEQKVWKSKYFVIPNGVEEERFMMNDSIDWHHELELSEDCFLIGFFGRFMEQKGFRYLVDSIELLSQKTLSKTPVVLAFGWDGFIREEQEYIKQRGLEGFFRFLPFQDNISSAVRGVDVVAMPSLWEAYGLLAAEVLISGTPLIGTDCKGLREVLENTPATIVELKNSKALASALIKEMDTPGVKSAVAYRQTACKRFSVKNQVVGIRKYILEMSGRQN